MFGAFPNTSFSQNVGLIAMTGVMSRHVVTIGAIFLIICGLVPKVGAVIRTVPIEVLGGGVIVMFGMVVAAGISMLSDVNWNRRNMVIFAIALSIGLGLQLDPLRGAVSAGHAAHPDDLRSVACGGDRHRAEPDPARGAVRRGNRGSLGRYVWPRRRVIAQVIKEKGPVI